MQAVDSEKLAYWYFRLNGFLTIENFVVHPDWKPKQRTDIDVIAVRFPYRNELPGNTMIDDTRIILDLNKIRIVLAEVTTSTCKLNKTWTDLVKRNMQQVISSIGSFEPEKVEVVSKELYNNRWYEDEDFVVSLCCIGKKKNRDIRERFPKVPQLAWDEVLDFIHKRFWLFQEQKRSHGQWYETGKKLWNCAMEFKEFNEFQKTIEIISKSSNPPINNP